MAGRPAVVAAVAVGLAAVAASVQAAGWGSMTVKPVAVGTEASVVGVVLPVGTPAAAVCQSSSILTC